MCLKNIKIRSLKIINKSIDNHIDYDDLKKFYNKYWIEYKDLRILCIKTDKGNIAVVLDKEYKHCDDCQYLLFKLKVQIDESLYIEDDSDLELSNDDENTIEKIGIYGILKNIIFGKKNWI